MYSRIPVPRAVWKDGTPAYTIGFFPWVGLIIGALHYAGFLFLPVPAPAKALILAVLPLIVTGGIHVDGFMDTADAFHSYGDREKKLEILSDPHIGAFSVIRLLILAGLYLAGLTVLMWDSGWEELQKEAVFCFSGGFILSRCASGILLIILPSAKKEGMASEMKQHSPSRVNLILLGIQAAAVIAAGVIISPLIMTMGVLAAMLVTVIFLFGKVRVLGGITGDLCGWYLSVTECSMLCAMAVIYIVLKGF